jgi:flagellar P-ring protein precursor FlgI
MKTGKLISMAVLALGLLVAGGVHAARIKDLGRVDGVRDNQLIGYGVVTGLAGTGDSLRNKATRQSLANLLGQFDLSVLSDQVQSRNVAIVMVTATLPAFARAGDKLDVTVTSAADARSLLGGVLMMAPLKGPDNRVHALAQGPVSVGGYKYDLNDNLVQKNHPTVGSIPAGANVELGEETKVINGAGSFEFVLNNPDYTTAERIANSINAAFGSEAAHARDAATIEVSPGPVERGALVRFMTRFENLSVDPDTRARVVINERTGTVISGGDARISRVTIAHGELKVSIVTENQVSQPMLVSRTGPDVRTEVVSNTRIDVSERTGVTLDSGNTVAELVRSLNRIKTSTRDMISILQGIKAAGALQAELIIQ